MKKAKTAKTRRPNRSELISAEVFQNNTHEATVDISRKREVLTCQLEAVEDEIKSLTADVTDARKRKSDIEAQIVGLSMVIARR